MKHILIFLLIQFFGLKSIAQIKYGSRDQQGRHEIARGFVVNTNDGTKDAYYTANDYLRMVKMGANYQVLRLEMGKLQPTNEPATITRYLNRLDTLVQWGKNGGMKTVFKMTLYGIKGFQWEKLFLNTNNEQADYIKAWLPVWNRYKKEDYVVGYDLVNEPRKEDMVIDYQDLSNKYLIPFYRVLVDEANKISTDKMYLVQDIFMNKGDKVDNNQYLELQTAINRKKLVFAPHIYETKKEQVEKNMQRFEKEANLLQAPMFVGEWGFPTFDKTDSTLSEQLRYIDFYAYTASIFDSLGVGSIKAWFSGNPTKQHFLGAPSTWAIFQDPNAVGTVERKYIIDIISRPYPQCIAGDILKFKFDFATRSLDVALTADNSKGASKLFISADRFYPDGFSVIVDDEMILCHNPLINAGLQVFKATGNSIPSDFIWDAVKNQLVVLRWPKDKANIRLRIVPGIYQ